MEHMKFKIQWNGYEWVLKACRFEDHTKYWVTEGYSMFRWVLRRKAKRLARERGMYMEKLGKYQLQTEEFEIGVG